MEETKEKEVTNVPFEMKDKWGEGERERTRIDDEFSTTFIQVIIIRIFILVCFQTNKLS